MQANLIMHSELFNIWRDTKLGRKNVGKRRVSKEVRGEERVVERLWSEHTITYVKMEVSKDHQKLVKNQS